MADIFTDFGYEADTAGDGLEALSKIRNRSYDVALLDFKMPGMDGLTLFREMRRLCPETSAILISAYTDVGVTEEATRSGICRIMSKPVDMDKVIEEVDRQLSHPVALLVDDDCDFCESLRDVLNEWQFRVNIACNEVRALEILSTRYPQVVVLDISLGKDSDAKRILCSVHAKCPTAVVILVTGYGTESSDAIDELMCLGANSICFKPIDPESLLKTLQNSLSPTTL